MLEVERSLEKKIARKNNIQRVAFMVRYTDGTERIYNSYDDKELKSKL